MTDGSLRYGGFAIASGNVNFSIAKNRLRLAGRLIASKNSAFVSELVRVPDFLRFRVRVRGCGRELRPRNVFMQHVAWARLVS